MYNESYEEYIRSILGYPNYNSSNSSCCENDYNPNMVSPRNNETNRQLEACYPEIYKIVYPMVDKACSSNTKPITSELIDELTEEIYAAVENYTEININFNLTNEIQSTGNRNASSSHVKTENAKEVPQNRGEDRQFRNRGLQDLIRILLIRELLGRPGRFPGNRPPFPPNRPPMMRPPFPGGPGGRPPIMPRGNYLEDIYEQEQWHV